MKAKYLIIISILIVLSLSTMAQNDTLFAPRKWELSFNIQYNQYKIDYRQYSPSFTNKVYSLPQFEIGIRRNFNINNKLTVSVGLSYRETPFIVEYGYSDSSHINLIDPKDYRFHAGSTSIDFPITIRYHIARLNNIKLISIYVGFNYSRLMYGYGFTSYRNRFYDEEFNTYINYQIYQNNYDNLKSYGSYSIGISDYSFLLGMDFYFSSRIKISPEIIYYPIEVLILKYRTSMSASWYASPEKGRVYRPKLFYRLGISYLF